MANLRTMSTANGFRELVTRTFTEARVVGARSSTVRCGAVHTSGSRRLVVRRHRVARALTEMRVATRRRSRNASAGTATGSIAPTHRGAEKSSLLKVALPIRPLPWQAIERADGGKILMAKKVIEHLVD